MNLYNSRKFRVYRRNATSAVGNMNTGLPKSTKSKACVSSGNCNTMKHGRESLYTQILPTNKLFVNSDNCGRSQKKLIRSGMQPKKGNKYCYDYNDYLKNKRKKTFAQKIPSSMPQVGQSNTFGHGGSCGLNDNCNENVTHYKPNNLNYRQQGAVDSSSRIDRLRYNTIVGSDRCDNDNTKCNGKYANSFSRFVEYKGLFNTNHPEPCNTQIKARRKSMGAFNKSCKVEPPPANNLK